MTGSAVAGLLELKQPSMSKSAEREEKIAVS